MRKLPVWYDCIEDPLKELIYILRNSGFNTFCSCGHYPSPHIQIEFYQDSDITRLWNLLTERGYINWQVGAYKNQDGTGNITIFFFPSDGEHKSSKDGLVPLKEILKIDQERLQ